jgi:hypothetical protein
MRPTVKSALIKYFDEHPDQRLHLEDIAKATQLTEEQVRTGVNNLRASEPIPYGNIRSIVRGRVWMYQTEDTEKPETRSTTDLMRVCYRSKHGWVLAEDHEGNLWKAFKQP